MEKFPTQVSSEDQYEKDRENIDWIGWVNEIGSILDIISNPEFKKSVENGKYNLLIIDDASGRIPGLIFHKIIDGIYKAKGFDNPHVLFIPGQRDALFMSQKLGTYIKEKVTKAHIDNPNALFITNMISSGDTLKVLSSGLDLIDIKFDIAALSLEAVRGDEKAKTDKRIDELQLKLGDNTENTRKFFVPTSSAMTGAFSPTQKKYNLAGVTKNPGELVSRKVSGVQDDINKTRKTIELISERILEKVLQNKELSEKEKMDFSFYLAKEISPFSED